MAKTLRMYFQDVLGEKVTLSLTDPRTDLTAQEVEDVMDILVANPIFGFGPSAVIGADMVDRTVTEIFMN